MVQESYGNEGLEKIQDRLEGENDYLEAESGLANLQVTEKDTKIDLVWETDSPFEEVLRPIESFYRRTNGIQVLAKDDETGDLSFSKVREYRMQGPTKDPFRDEVDRDILDWSEYHLIQIGGEDFQITWDQKGEDMDYRVRVSTFGSGMKPFQLVYDNTVGVDTQQVLSDVEEEFYDHPRQLPGYWDPSKRLD